MPQKLLDVQIDRPVIGDIPGCELCGDRLRFPCALCFEDGTSITTCRKCFRMYIVLEGLARRGRIVVRECEG